MKYYLFIITAAIIFGSSGVLVKIVDLPVSSITFFRMCVPFLLMSALFLIKSTPFPSLKDRYMILASLLNAARMFFFFAGYTYGNISTTVILLYTWPVFTTIWSAMFLGEHITLRRIVFFLATLTGVALININQTLSLSDSGFTGMVCILISAFLYSMTIVIFKSKSTTYTPWQTVWFQNLLGTFIFLPLIFINHPRPEIWQAGLASTYAILIGVVGFGLFFYGLRKIDASRASFLTYIEVVSGILFGVAFFNEVLSWNVIIGGLLVVLSAIALSRLQD